MSATGARSGGNVASDDPAGTTVTRRDARVSRAKGVTWPPFASWTVAPISICRASASVMMSKVFTQLLLQDRNIRKVAIFLGVVQSVAHHEFVLDGESD